MLQCWETCGRGKSSPQAGGVRDRRVVYCSGGVSAFKAYRTTEDAFDDRCCVAHRFKNTLDSAPTHQSPNSIQQKNAFT